MSVPPSLSAELIIPALLLALIVPQILLTAWFIWNVRARTRAHLLRCDQRDGSGTIPAVVVLCLRGCDPTLEEVLAALARQCHRNWRLQVVVDSADDPAWDVAHATLARLAAGDQVSWHDYSITPLAERPATGSLKCASLRQALATLAPETQVVALIDADSIVHEQWLLTLVDECMRPGVGAVSGNRWYEPRHDSLPGTVRAIWNAGAVVQMTAFGIPWGGSLAVRCEALAACGWASVIEATLCEDTALAAPLHRAGWLYRFIPSLVAVDCDDDVAIVPLTRWISRQLLTARLHHPMWPLVAIHGLSTSFTLAAAVCACVVAAARGHGQSLLVFGGALLAYEATSILLVLMIEDSIKHALTPQGTRFRPLSAGQLLWRCGMLPVTQYVYAAAMLSALATRSIEWRGIVYEITRTGGSLEVRIKD